MEFTQKTQGLSGLADYHSARFGKTESDYSIQMKYPTTMDQIKSLNRPNRKWCLKALHVHLVLEQKANSVVQAHI